MLGNHGLKDGISLGFSVWVAAKIRLRMNRSEDDDEDDVAAAGLAQPFQGSGPINPSNPG